MGSVDLAFYSLWQKYFPEIEVHFLQLFTDQEQLRHRDRRKQEEFATHEVMPFQYTSFRNHLPELYAGGGIIFWGDFLHMYHYRTQIAERLLSFGLVSHLNEGIATVDRHFFLTDAPESVLRKTLSFGGNLLFNRASCRLEPAYDDALRRLALQARRIWMRDVFSAMLVNRLRNDWTSSHLGVDCALLLENTSLAAVHRRWNGMFPKQDGRGVAGVFFSRNTLPVRFMLSFARAICKACGVRTQWLPWRKVKFARWSTRLMFPELEMLEANEPPSLADLLDLIGRYEFVITDTYHVCVNAWRLGKPAICIGETWTQREMDVSCGPAGSWSDKRWVFHAMNGALDFYVHAAELRDRRWRERRAAEIAGSLRNRPLIDKVFQDIMGWADAARRELLRELLPLTGQAREAK
jgi:hypothetical protein